MRRVRPQHVRAAQHPARTGERVLAVSWDAPELADDLPGTVRVPASLPDVDIPDYVAVEYGWEIDGWEDA